MVPLPFRPSACGAYYLVALVVCRAGLCSTLCRHPDLQKDEGTAVSPDAMKADCYSEVREAAREWRRVHVIAESSLCAIHSLYPDDRVRVGPFFRILLFVLTFFGAFFAGCVVLLLLDAFGIHVERSLEALVILVGIILLATTDYQIRILKRCQAGTEAATSALGLLLIVIGTHWDFSQNWQDPRWPLLLWAVLFACACIRWGYELYGMVAAALFFLFLARFPGPGFCWIVVATALLYPVQRLSNNPRLAPSHRRAFSLVSIVLLAALYIAVHIGVFDHSGTYDWVGPAIPVKSAFVKTLLRGLSITLTGLIPLIALFHGIRTRQRLFLNAGLVMGIVSLVTLRYYVHVAPLWVILVLAGAVALVGALALRRWLNLSPDGERKGFTADPLLQDVERKSMMETVAGTITLTPSAAAPDDKPGFQGGGGASGGAGAGGTF